MKKFLKIVGYIVACLLLVAICLFTPDDTSTPFEEQPYYSQTIDSIQHAILYKSTGQLRAGWNSQNITPSNSIELAGFGIRKKYERVHDSIFVKALALQIGTNKAIVLGYDLLMVHPDLAKVLIDSLKNAGLGEYHTYFTATHTHNSIGGWAHGIASKFILGGYNDTIVGLIASKTVLAAKMAIQDSKPATISYGKIRLDDMVLNRIEEGGNKDPYLRALQIHTQQKSMLLMTFTAHAICTSDEKTTLTADYPGELCAYITRKSRYDMAMFCAGAVGSHNPNGEDGSLDLMKVYAHKMGDRIIASLDSFTNVSSSEMSFISSKIYANGPTLRISKHWRLRSWAFESVMGADEPEFVQLKIGNCVLAGMPCDFSGLLNPELDRYYSSKNEIFIPTSFNGHYMGYIIPDKCYDFDESESFEMNWFGQQTGSYFIKILKKLSNRM